MGAIRQQVLSLERFEPTEEGDDEFEDFAIKQAPEGYLVKFGHVLNLADKLDKELSDMVEAVGSLPRFEMKDWESGAFMVDTKDGEYLEREAVLKALQPK